MCFSVLRFDPLASELLLVFFPYTLQWLALIFFHTQILSMMLYRHSPGHFISLPLYHIHRKICACKLNNYFLALNIQVRPNMSGPTSLAVISFIKNWQTKLRLLVDLRTSLSSKGHNSHKNEGIKISCQYA